MIERAFVIAAFGDRQVQVKRLVENICQYSKLPINIITTKDSNIGLVNVTSKDGQWINEINIHIVERLWSKGSYRADIRNSNYFKVKFALDNDCKSLCMLDDDMLIVNSQFVDGFRIAERFGGALPMNPRTYVGYNMMGADVKHQDIDEVLKTPIFAPACNFSPFFVDPRVTMANVFLDRLKDELKNNVCRGTLAIWKASWQTGFTPVYLPEQWCVCGENAEYIKNCSIQLKGQPVKVPTMALHLGHEKVQQIFGIN